MSSGAHWTAATICEGTRRRGGKSSINVASVRPIFTADKTERRNHNGRYPDRQGSHVTGGPANLGKLFSESLAADGANVVVHYNSARRAEEGAKAVAELKGYGVQAVAHQGDLTKRSEITKLVDAIVDCFGHWDILVNTSGLIVRKPLAETTEEEYVSSFAINAKVPFFLMSEAFTKMANDRSQDRSGNVFVNGGMISPID
jgi:NAD(P)-dependent dehydrogenase (short-subunit alcohol dehydrogenase family)